MREMLREIIDIVKEAGKIILAANNIQNSVESKEGRANFVTKYDLEVQSFLYTELSKLYPTAAFIGEEDKESNVGKIMEEYCFIIDPIDGTTNFILNYQHSAISVALLYRGCPAAGIVYNPFLDEVFYAEKGTGAYLNGHPLKIKNQTLSEGLAAIGTCPYNREMAEETFAISRKIYDKVLDFRRTGSAALDICYVAAGRFVIYFEMRLSPWDYAAASLILSEAGGRISTMEKSELTFTEGCSAIAATPAAYEEFFKL
jgi:myo-inositol-1(or 4)-monophosphatase